MKIERTWFEGGNPHREKVKVADGEPHFDYFPDGHVEIFIPDHGGASGHVITLTREEAEHLQ
jgi:hypothetical protein